ncbi:MAG: hypothetical protein AABX05_04140, partial [Nanoarchaeota archaeon]
MIGKKRGLFIVVVLVVLLSFSGVADWVGHCPNTDGRCVSLVFGTTECNGCDEGTYGFNDCNSGDMMCQSFELYHLSLSIMETTSEGCKFGPDHNTQVPTPDNGGCWVIGGDGDLDPDDCGATLALHGQKWGNGHKISEASTPYFQTWNGDSADAFATTMFTTISNAWEYMCSDDGMWHLCVDPNSDPNSIGRVTWANGKLFECQEIPDQGYLWAEIDADADHDGYGTKEGDCLDNPSIDLPFCPKFDNTELAGKKLDEIKTIAKDACDKNPVKYASCSICINPGAPEVCGDKLNNDCGGSGSSEQLQNLGGETSDDCDLNEEACTQKATEGSAERNKFCVKDGHITNTVCTADGDECDTEGGESCIDVGTFEDGGYCLSDEEGCIFPASQSYNIYNEEFSYVKKDPESSEGMCCGYRGVEDLGDTYETTEGSFICLDSQLVGTEKDGTGKNWIGDLLSGTETDNIRCGDDWCWVNAIGNAKFQIATINKPGELSYDVVSNNNGWYECKAETVNSKVLEDPSPNEEGSLEDDLYSTHRFYCYSEGNHYSFAECGDVTANRKNVGVKGRFQGEGLYSLPLTNNEGATLPERSGKAIDINSNWYKEFYGGGVSYAKNFYWDFTGYDYLNFMVQLISDKEGTTVITDPSHLPVMINLKILGANDAVYYDGNVFGYVQNGPLFDPDNFMHIKVPVGDYKAVKTITISVGGPSSVDYIKVKNVYLSKSDNDLLCSGKDTFAANTNSWLDSIDSGNPGEEITGEELCTQLYGDNAWLGNDEEVDKIGVPTANCCGNNADEYYSGTTKEPTPDQPNRFGCWNSQPIESGKTIMNVEFNVTYTEEANEVNYGNLMVEAPQTMFLRIRNPDAVEPYKAGDYASYGFVCDIEPNPVRIFDKSYSVLSVGENFR